MDASERAAVEGFRLDQLRTLRSIDAAVGRIVAALRQTGRLHDTLIVFMSDNGIQWGEHRVTGKATAYEESIHVPLVVRYDRLIRRPGPDGHLIVNVDLAPTMAEAAGIVPPATEGSSFLPFLSGSSARWRSGFLLEHMETPHLSPSPSFCGWHTRRYVYVDYASGRDELYDLKDDPFQLENAIDRTSMADVLDGLRARVRDACVPPPPGW
jgi:arylsulfatase A-like enzyme